MTSFAAEFATIAADLIAAYGAPATLRRVIRAYVVASGTTTETVVDQATSALLERRDSKTTEGKAQTKLMASLPAQGIVDPRPGDRLIVGAQTYDIVAVQTTAPDGQSIYHKLELR